MSLSPRGNNMLHHILAQNDALTAGGFSDFVKKAKKGVNSDFVKKAKKGVNTAIKLSQSKEVQNVLGTLVKLSGNENAQKALDYSNSPQAQQALNLAKELTASGRKRKVSKPKIHAGSFKSIMKSVGKVASKGASAGIHFAGTPAGQALIKTAVLAATAAGRKVNKPAHLVKGSPEAKAHMAKLRAMRK